MHPGCFDADQYRKSDHTPDDYRVLPGRDYQLLPVGHSDGAQAGGGRGDPVAVQRDGIPPGPHVLHQLQRGVLQQLVTGDSPARRAGVCYSRGMAGKDEKTLMEHLPLILAVAAAITSALVFIKDWRFGKPDALKRYQELANDLTSRVDHLNDVISIQATKIEAQTAKLEAQATKIEAQASKI